MRGSSVLLFPLWTAAPFIVPSKSTSKKTSAEWKRRSAKLLPHFAPKPTISRFKTEDLVRSTNCTCMEINSHSNSLFGLIHFSCRHFFLLSSIFELNFKSFLSRTLVKRLFSLRFNLSLSDSPHSVNPVISHITMYQTRHKNHKRLYIHKFCFRIILPTNPHCNFLHYNKFYN